MKKIAVIFTVCLLLGLAAPIYAQVYNPANGHYYELIDSNLTWYDARDAAAGMSYNGMQGHLATITSSGENNFVLNEWPDLGEDFEFWIGGTDEASEDDWEWITDEPWSYTNWNSGEPNDSGDGEDCLNYKMNFIFYINWLANILNNGYQIRPIFIAGKSVFISIKSKNFCFIFKSIFVQKQNRLNKI